MQRPARNEATRIRRPRRSGRTSAPAALILLLLAAAPSTWAANKAKGVITADTSDGAEIYRVTCAVCHGEGGNADSFAGQALQPRPRDFTDRQVIATLTRDRMIAAVTHGRPKTAMQPFKKQLTPKQIDIVVDYIRNTFMTTRAAVVATGVQADLRAGRAVYNFRCYLCHGYGGDARTRAARTLKPPPLDFTDAARMKDISDRRMFDAIKNGRPATGMASFARVLSDADIANVVAFIRHAFVEKRAENITYHSPENGWYDFEAGYPEATRYFRYEGREADLPQALEVGRRMFEASCVTCHLRKRPVPAIADAAVWSTQ